MQNIAIFYGSDTGNTEDVAKQLAQKLQAETFDVAKKPADKLSEYTNLIFGTSTMGLGDLQDDWDEFLGTVEKTDLSGKVIALFGLGDADMYPDTFLDGVGTIYNVLKNKGCKIIGQVATDAYDFDESTAVVDNKFVGLPLDQDNEDDLTETRIDNWVAQIQNEFV